MDLNLPDLIGDAIVRELYLNNLKTKIIIVSRNKYLSQIQQLLDLDISGYVLKDQAAYQLNDALKSALEDKIFISPSIEEVLQRLGYIDNRKKPTSKKSRLQLTTRELEIAQKFSQGVSRESLANMLSISGSTVRVHLKNIVEKLALDNAEELMKMKSDFA